MTISYNWLSEYLPVTVEPERLSKILTSIGLEVESLERFESMKGGLAGLVVGEVVSVTAHPNADKLRLTEVNTGGKDNLQIVCGAPNVAGGQKVVVAPVGSTIYPKNGTPLTMKVAKIRGIESFGMICAEDEIGISENHEGIMILPAELKPGTPASDYFHPYTDWVYEIGLTPNRMDAMSHLGVARDVCAYLTHHDKTELKPKYPYSNAFKPGGNTHPVEVIITNPEACKRYSGVSISGITVGPSPKWLQDRLLAIGQRPINNIVDITNFVLHETGQPLHAFDLDEIGGGKILVKNLAEGTIFQSLDEKERALSAQDLMICDGNSAAMCIAGVFGGLRSGVKSATKNIFLESAWFNPIDIRKTSFRHNLRTEAASRFEKNVDISNTVNVLKRAALLIQEIAGGVIASELVDLYPGKEEKTSVGMKYHYLKKLSGKNYHPDTVKKILVSLGFDIEKEGIDDIRVSVPYSKPDISLPADIVEEIMRIDGYDNIEIPGSITISPSTESDGHRYLFIEKAASYLIGTGFHEIFTNSITNAAYFEESELENSVRLLNNLSAVHNIMRPSMLETGLEAVAYNLNRKNSDLQFFEFGKTYKSGAENQFIEIDHLCLYVTGNIAAGGWKQKAGSSDLFYMKGLVTRILQLAGADKTEWKISQGNKFASALQVFYKNQLLAELGTVSSRELNRFDIKQPVYFADIQWNALLHVLANHELRFVGLPKQLPVYRDLALIVPASTKYETVQSTIQKAKLDKLQSMKLFDIFESEKLGAGKKSMAFSFTFLDEEKTLTDKEIDAMMNSIMNLMETELNAEIRK